MTFQDNSASLAFNTKEEIDSLVEACETTNDYPQNSLHINTVKDCWQNDFLCPKDRSARKVTP
jgi:hypothetical protein